jgi:hypothetical protein
MGLRADISFKKISLKGAYFRIARLYGGKQEKAWNATVDVFPTAEAANPPVLPATVKVMVEGQTVEAAINRQAPVEPLESFNVTAPYSADEMNPFKLLYPEARKAVAEKYKAEIDTVLDC